MIQFLSFHGPLFWGDMLVFQIIFLLFLPTYTKKKHLPDVGESLKIACQGCAKTLDHPIGDLPV